MQTASIPNSRLRPAAWLVALLVASCSEPPPTTVVEFVEDPRLLEATMLRCADNRAELRYTQECLNAREAVDRIAAREAAERRADLEAESERKREALRRRRQLEEEARARAEEEERLRQEAEYLSQFGEAPAGAPADPAQGEATGTVPSGTTMPAAEQPGDDAPAAADTRDEPPGDERSLEDLRRELEQRSRDDGQ